MMSASGTLEILKAFEKVCLTYPYTSEVESERELIEIIQMREAVIE
jgi:hypothetical protein